MNKKKNPWNIEMQIHFCEIKKKKIIDWYNSVKKINNCNRKKFINENPLDIECKDYLSHIYNDGYGYKIIARTLGLTYTQIRVFLIKYLNLEVRKGYNVTTDKVKEFRSFRVRKERSPFYNWPENKKIFHKINQRSIQGYYCSKNNGYIWLRSTWEYIYVKWLEKNNINWKYEPKTFLLSNGETYRPDFKIIDNNGFYYVEIKGKMFDQRLYKIDLFKKEYKDIKIIVIKDISQYTEKSYRSELRLWKQTKLSQEELKKLQ